jgi:hypothetical protein
MKKRENRRSIRKKKNKIDEVLVERKGRRKRQENEDEVGVTERKRAREKNKRRKTNVVYKSDNLRRG